MAEYLDPDPDFKEPEQAMCLKYQELAAEFRSRWQLAIDNPDVRDALMAQIETVRTSPLGDAMQTILGVDLGDNYCSDLNAIPDAPRQDLVDAAVDALTNGYDARISFAHSGAGVTAAEVRRWYRNGDASTPALIELRLTAPES